MSHQISRNYTNKDFGGKPKLDDKILIFEDRVLNWHLNIVELIRNHMEAKEQNGTDWNHAGFAMLTLLFTYFEMIAQYKQGKSSNKASQKMFCYGVDDVYPGKFSMAKRKKIYTRVRCGMYHNAFVKKGTLIDGGFTDAIEVENGGNVKINPHVLSPEVKKHFVAYVAELKDEKNKALRKKFEKVFDA
ncbi:hypothetical protein GC197_14455 [bacterium]|nr:hypothetical protein [bacterium]